MHSGRFRHKCILPMHTSVSGTDYAPLWMSGATLLGPPSWHIVLKMTLTRLTSKLRRKLTSPHPPTMTHTSSQTTASSAPRICKSTITVTSHERYGVSNHQLDSLFSGFLLPTTKAPQYWPFCEGNPSQRVSYSESGFFYVVTSSCLVAHLRMIQWNEGLNVIERSSFLLHFRIYQIEYRKVFKCVLCVQKYCVECVQKDVHLTLMI